VRGALERQETGTAVGTRQQFLEELIKEAKKMSPEEKAQARKNIAARLGVPYKED
jgi:ribosomal protein L18E